MGDHRVRARIPRLYQGEFCRSSADCLHEFFGFGRVLEGQGARARAGARASTTEQDAPCRDARIFPKHESGYKRLICMSDFAFVACLTGRAVVLHQVVYCEFMSIYMQDQYEELTTWKNTFAPKPASMPEIFRGTIGVGDLLYVPPGFLFTELCNSGSYSLGIKLPVLCWHSDATLRRLKLDSDLWGQSPALLKDVVEALCSLYIVGCIVSR